MNFTKFNTLNQEEETFSTKVPIRHLFTFKDFLIILSEELLTYQNIYDYNDSFDTI